MIKQFEEWLLTYPNTKKGFKLSKSTAYKYSRAIITTSEEMLALGIINVNLINIIDESELSQVIIKIKDSKNFIDKNNRGNKMYSNALDYYLEFIKNS